MEYIYMESHHICPKAKDLFPEYASFRKNKWNKIDLTARQHFIIHWILWKTYSGSQTDAFWAMQRCSGNQERYFRVSSKTYEQIKLGFSSRHSERMKGENNPFYKKTHTKENLEFFRDSQKGISIVERVGEEKAREIEAKQKAYYDSIRKPPKPKKSKEQKSLELSIRMTGKNKGPSKRPDNPNNVIFEFLNVLTNETFIGTGYDLRKKYNLLQASMSDLVNRKRNNHKGWVIVENGKHNYVSRSDQSRQSNKRRIEAGTHPFQKRADGTSISGDKVKNGTHPLLAKNRKN